MHTILAIPVGMFGMPVTSRALLTANEGFLDAATIALETDPDLCKLICRGGIKSARFALALVYGQMLAVVGPIAWEEIKSHQHEREETDELVA